MSTDAEFWNDLAERYAQKPVGNPAAFEAKIAIMKSRMKPTDVVLDIGCGTGSLALRLAPSAAHVHGLDLSSGAYSILRLLHDRPAALSRIFGLLAPGGFFISSTVCLGESWVPYGPLLRVMRALGKAPMVKVFAKRTLEDELRRAGFIELAQPDVGADRTTAFIVATKPR